MELYKKNKYLKNSNATAQPHKSPRRGLSLWLFLLSSLLLLPALSHSKSLAIYYSSDIPWQQLQLFDTIIVEPEQVKDQKQIQKLQPALYAYVSLGEVDRYSRYRQAIPKKWLKTTNDNWDSSVIDQTQTGWQRFFIDKIITPLWQQGYRNFFLDTIDSYQLFAKSANSRQQQEAAIIKLIKSIKQRYPKAKIILNRGFEILPQVHSLIDGLLAESLYKSYDAGRRQYVDVPQQERSWLLNELNKAKQYNLDIYIVDYLPVDQFQQAKSLVEKIALKGFIPYVSNGLLTAMGVSTIEPMPREVILIYSAEKSNTTKASTEAIKLYTMPLNYLGYQNHAYEARERLPSYPLINRTAGVVVAINSAITKNTQKLRKWLLPIIKNNIPVVFLGEINFVLNDPLLSKQLGLKKVLKRSTIQSAKWQTIDSSMIGFESQPILDINTLSPIYAAPPKKAYLQVKVDEQELFDAAVKTRWGGFALNPNVTHSYLNEQSVYIINPFKFFKETLRLQTLPIPDVTTEYGNRILITHIDGDAFISQSEWPNGPMAAESLYKTILKDYKIPHTISIVEGEISPTGLYPKLSAKSIAIAKDIFKLPFVEAASHSYSHPYNWAKAELYPSQYQINSKETRLPINNYHLTPKREIAGSVDFINALLPANKKTKVFLWTGDTSPTVSYLKETYQLGLLNMNGGDTIITKSAPSLTNVAPLAMYIGKYLQILAPMQNENMYTNLWEGPFYGFRRVIETFKMTNQPRRLKPINIYYHFYSATKVASLKALYAVYDWALKQAINPIYSSSYIKKVMDFYSLGIAKVDNHFKICGNGQISTFRINQQRYPVLNSSIVGFSDFNDQRYVHTTKQRCHQLQLSHRPPSELYLVRSNGLLTDYQQQGANYTWQFKAHIPLTVAFNNALDCKFESDDKALVPELKNSLWHIKFKTSGLHTIKAQCLVAP